MISIRFISAALLVAAAAAPLACTVEKAPAAAPAPAPVAAAPAPPPPGVPAAGKLVCPPLGTWKVGTQTIRVTDSSKPGEFDIWYNGATASVPGQKNNNHLAFDTGAASGGLAACDMADDCKTMACGFKGQQPVVFTKQ